MTCPICDFELKRFPDSVLPRYKTCPLCTGHFIPQSKKIKVSYPGSYFDEGKKYSLISNIVELPLNIFLEMKVAYIKNVLGKENGKILDYGCGSGKLVKKLLDMGYKITGFEPSSGALKIVKKQNLPVYSKVKTISNGYDLIMFWQSLEHTDYPLKILKEVTKLLNKRGKILIAVPNSDSWNAIFGKKKWFHYTYPLHKIHFNPESLKLMAKKSGYKVEHIDFFNPEYTLSGLIQTFLNLFFPQDVLYSFVAHRRSTLSKTKTFYYFVLSIFLVLLFSPILLLLYLLELIFKKTDAMLITLCR